MNNSWNGSGIVGYSSSQKAYRVHNKRTRIVQESFYIDWQESNIPNTGSDPAWFYDVYTVIQSFNLPSFIDNDIHPTPTEIIYMILPHPSLQTNKHPCHLNIIKHHLRSNKWYQSFGSLFGWFSSINHTVSCEIKISHLVQPKFYKWLVHRCYSCIVRVSRMWVHHTH